MNKNWVLLGVLLLQSVVSYAASGIAGYERTDVTVKYKVKNVQREENITCIQDAKDEYQWYYVTNQPRLAEDGKGNPKFMMVSYQDETKGKSDNGGVLQCAFNLSVPETAFDQLKKGIANYVTNGLKKREYVEKRIKLAPLDMKNAKIAVYAPGGEKIATDIISPDVGPSFANECIPVQMNLTALGVPTAEALLKGNGGLTAFFIFDFDALTPECNVKITANYDQLYKHFSTNTKARVAYAVWVFGASANTDISTIKDELVKNKCIEIESTTGEALTDEMLNTYMKPILDKITEEIFNVSEPAKAEPVKSAELEKSSSLSSAFRKASFDASLNVKSQQDRKTGSFTFNMKNRKIVTRKTSVGGIIGLSQYTKEQREAAIVTIDPTYWAKAYYSLPSIAPDDDVVDMAISVNMLYNGKQAPGTEQQLAKLSKSREAWVNAAGDEILSLPFALKYTYDQLKKDNKFSDNLKATREIAKGLEFEQTLTLTYKDGRNKKQTVFKDVLPAFKGDVAMNDPAVSFSFVTFDGSYLTWDKKEGLQKVLISFDAKVNGTKKPFKLNINENNDSVTVLVDKDYDKKTGAFSDQASDIKVTYTVKTTGNSKADTVVVDKKGEPLTGNIELDDSDYE